MVGHSPLEHGPLADRVRRVVFQACVLSQGNVNVTSWRKVVQCAVVLKAVKEQRIRYSGRFIS